MQPFPKSIRPHERLSGRGYLAIATIIFGAASAVTRKLNELGAQHLINGRNPISFCNSLFVGNLCALVVLTAIYYRDWTSQSLKQIQVKDWLLLTVVATLGGALAPALIFTALDRTMVNNVILIGRIEPPITLALSVWLLRERTNIWVIAGAIAAFLGVALTVLLQQSGVSIGQGEVMTIFAALAIAISTVISQAQLARIPLGIFSVFRMAIGTLVFGTVVIKIYGWSHFTDVFSPLLWEWMLIYSAIIVVGGQLCWFQGLKKSTAADVSLVNSLNPIAGILAAYFILGEAPNSAQYIGGSLILVGIVLGQIGVAEQRRRTIKYKPQAAIAMDMSTGFKGV